MKEYIFIVTGIALIIAILYLLTRFSNKFRNKAYKLFLYAENNIFYGEDKMNYVVEQIYDYLPAILRILPQSFYKMILQKMFNEIKDLLDDGRFNKSVKEVNDEN